MGLENNYRVFTWIQIAEESPKEVRSIMNSRSLVLEENKFEILEMYLHDVTSGINKSVNSQ